MKKYNCDGQMSLFDFIDSPAEENYTDIEAKLYKDTILRGSGFANGKTRICKYFEDEADTKKRADFLKQEYGVGGWSTDFGFVDCGAGGLDFNYSEEWKTEHPSKSRLVHSGWPMVAQKIAELIESGEYKPDIEKKVCEFSGHTCNKEELWKVAIEIDTQCPKKCCRLCDIQDCGARCNGAPKEPPILLKEGQVVYTILRCEIIPYKVSGNSWTYEHQTGRERGYDLLTLDEHPSHSVCSNGSIGHTVYTTLEAAQNWQKKMIEIFGDKLLPAEKMHIEKVVAYSYTHKDFYSNGEDRLITNFYAILDNGLIYLHTGSKYEHCYQDIQKGIKEFEDDKANLIKWEKELTDIEDYVPTLQNMYKSGHDSWDYSEARYSYMGVNNGIKEE